MEDDDDQDRGDEENEQKVETLERGKRSKRREKMDGQTHDDMWMSALFARHVLQHLEPCGACEKKDEMCAHVREKYAV